jgi:hemolysin III
MHSHLGDRLANSISHGIGVLLSVAGLAYLLVQSDTELEFFAVTIYGISLIALYVFSTIHHAIKMPTEKGFYILQSLDQVAIYILIVGTYTPFILLRINSTLSVVLLITLWVIAGVGIVLKLYRPKKWIVIHVILYLIMGWSILILWFEIDVDTLQQIIPYIVLGGALYSGGIPFYILSHAKKNWHYTHLVWHLFVLGGSIIHFVAVSKIL